MQVRPRRITRRPDCTNRLAPIDILPTPDGNAAQVSVQRKKIAVGQYDTVSIAPVAPPGKDYCAGRGGEYRRADGHGKVDAAVSWEKATDNRVTAWQRYAGMPIALVRLETA